MLASRSEQFLQVCYEESVSGSTPVSGSVSPVPPPTHAYSCHDTISQLALTRTAKARALLWDLHHCELNESLPFTYHSALSILL